MKNHPKTQADINIAAEALLKLSDRDLKHWQQRLLIRYANVQIKNRKKVKKAA